MKTWKLVAGIISIIFSILVSLSSIGMDVSNRLNDIDYYFVNTGYFVGEMLFIGGILSIISRKNAGKDGDAVLIFIFGFSALIALFWHGFFTGLIIWGIWCGINAILAMVDYFQLK